MARRRRAELSIFNFAFIDILATTIGVIMFIMVTAMLSSSARISGADLNKQSDRAHDDLIAALPEASLATRDLAGARVIGEAAREMLEKARHEVSGCAGELEELSGQLAKVEGKTMELIDRKNAGRAALGKLEEQVAENELALAKQKPQKEKVDFRLPVERETKKKPIFFECDDGKVFYLGCDGEVDESAYSVTGLGGFGILQRLDTAKGETFDAAQKQGSLFRKAFTERPKKDFYVHFLVRSDSFGIYRKLRQGLWEGGFELNWEVFDAEGTSYIVGGGGGEGGKVQ
jgi:hypothetical protein